MDKDEILNEFKIDLKIGGIVDKFLNGKYNFDIFFVLDNRSSLERKFKINKAIYITKDREQIEQSEWRDNYSAILEQTIKPNSFKQIELLFSKLQLKSISEGDQLFVSFEIPEMGKFFESNFQNINGSWILDNIESKDVEIELTENQLKNKLVKSIERLEIFEKEIGITFEKLSITKIENNQFTLLTEINSSLDLKIKDDLRIFCIVYNSKNEILYTHEEYINAQNFYGFEIVKFWIYPVNPLEVKSIRLFPKK